MPALPEAERRRRSRAGGGKPRIPDLIKKRYIKLRVKDKWTQAAAADKVGISIETGRRIERREDYRVARSAEPPDPIPYAKLSADAKRALEDFDFYLSEYFPTHEKAPWHRVLAEVLLEKYYNDGDDYVDLNAPPRVGKSTVVTHRFVSWVIVRERAFGSEPRVQLGHRTESQANHYVTRLERTFTHNRKLLRNFGRFKPNIPNQPWSRQECLIEPLEWDELEEKEPTISSASQEMGFIGSGFHLIIWDDLVDKQNTMTIKARADLVDMMETEAENRLDSPGLFILSGHRYGPEDLHHNRLQLVNIEDMDPDGRPKKLYVHVKLPAHYDDYCDGAHRGPIQFGKDNQPMRGSGCLLDPRRISWQKLNWHRSKNEKRFRLVWQQEDVDPKGALAEEIFFTGGVASSGVVYPGCFDQARQFGQLPDRADSQSPIVSVISVDPSSKNYWAVVHYLIYPGEQYVVLRGVRQTMQAPDLLYRDQMGSFTGILEDYWQAAAAQGVPYRYCVVEARGAQAYLLQYEFVQSWAAARGVTIIPHDTHRSNKADPDRGVEVTGPLYRQGQLSIPYLGYEVQLFGDAWKREACSWPEGETWDLVMNFWFVVYRAQHLLLAEMEEEQTTQPEAPAWASVETPAWAGATLGGGMPGFAEVR